MKRQGVLFASSDIKSSRINKMNLPGCFSAGDTLDEAITHAKEAITGHIELLIELGQNIPAVSSISQLVKKAEYAGYTWAVVEIDITRLMGGQKRSMSRCLNL